MRRTVLSIIVLALGILGTAPVANAAEKPGVAVQRDLHRKVRRTLPFKMRLLTGMSRLSEKVKMPRAGKLLPRLVLATSLVLSSGIAPAGPNGIVDQGSQPPSVSQTVSPATQCRKPSFPFGPFVGAFFADPLGFINVAVDGHHSQTSFVLMDHANSSQHYEQCVASSLADAATPQQ